jgi:hypothetical protein
MGFIYLNCEQGIISEDKPQRWRSETARSRQAASIQGNEGKGLKSLFAFIQAAQPHDGLHVPASVASITHKGRSQHLIPWRKLRSAANFLA